MAGIAKDDEKGEIPGKSAEFIEVSCNWTSKNNKNIRDSVSAISASPETPERISFSDVVSLESCVNLFPSSSENEKCTLEIKITNDRRIKKIAVVSEATTLEFFKQSGEYSGTIVAEFVDEFEHQSVYFAEAAIEPPSSEASIKFAKTRTKTPEMWVYGIKLLLVPAPKPSKFDLDTFTAFFTSNSKSSPQISTKEIPMDRKLREMEQRLSQKLEESEERIQRKLDAIMELLKR